MNIETRQSLYVTIIFGLVSVLVGVVITATDKSPNRITVQVLTDILLLAFSLAIVVWVIRTGAVQLKGRLRIVCWQGYRPIIADMSTALRRSHALVISATTYIGKGIYAALKSVDDQVDLIVFDIEALPDLMDPHGRIDAAIPPARRLIAYDDIFGPAFTQPLKERVFDCFIAIDKNKTYGFPLRFGINALSFNSEAINAEQLRSYSVLTDPADDIYQILVSQKKLGIWDWYLPTMGTLSIALGHKQPFHLSKAEFDALKTMMKNLRPAVHEFYAEPRSLMADLEAGYMWLVPGGGEWHVPVKGVGRYRKALSVFRDNPSLLEALEETGLLDRFQESRAELTTHIDWTIPSEGGLYWVECIGVCEEFVAHSHSRKHGAITPDMLRSLLEDAFLDIWRQQEFSRLEFYRANTVVRNAIKAFPPGQKKLLHTYTDKGIEHRTKSLIRREYPPLATELTAGQDCVAREEWEQFWDDEFRQ